MAICCSELVPDQTIGGKSQGCHDRYPVALSAAAIQGLSFVLLGLSRRYQYCIQADPNQV